MKKNMLTIVVLAVSTVNLILSALLIFAVVPASNKTNRLISQVASVLDLELETAAKEEKEEVKIEDRDTYVIEEEMLINLEKASGSTKEHYASIKKITLIMNKKAKGYSKLQPTLETNGSVITDIVRNVFTGYTLEEAKESESSIKGQVLQELQKQYDSEFLIDISFGNITYQ